MYFFLSTLLSGYVCESNVQAGAFFKQAGLALTNIKDAATSTAASAASVDAAEHPEVKQDKYNKGEGTTEQVEPEMTRLFIAYAALIGYTEEVFDLIDRGDFTGYGGGCAHVVATLMKDIANVGGGYDEAGYTIALVNRNTLGITFSYIFLKRSIGHFLVESALSKISPKKHKHEGNDQDGVQPIQVELRKIIFLLRGSVHFSLD